MFKNLSIRYRIFGLLSLVLGCLVMAVLMLLSTMGAIGHFSTGELQKNMLELEKAKIQIATHAMAISLGDLLAGLDEDQKVEAIRTAVKNIRYEQDHSGYFFANKGTTTVAHPTKPSLHGKDIQGATDKNGVFFIKELDRLAHGGGGFVSYIYPKPEKGDQPKLGYAEMIPGSDFWIGTGIYIDNIDAAKAAVSGQIDDIVKHETLSRTGVIAAILALIVLPMSIYIISTITKPLRKTMEAADEVAHGNLDIALDPQGRNEIAQMQESLGTMVMTLKDNIAGIEAKEAEANKQAEAAQKALQKAEEAMARAEIATREGMLTAADRLEGVVTHINVATGDIAGRSEEIRSGTDVQMERINEAATAMEEMNATVLEVARNAGDAAQQSDQSRARALEGAELVCETVEAMSDLQELTMELRQNMHKLGAQSEAIGQVMNVINDIADQTNLLALNAAIEAARAGDAGRGFAVVADEVRKLAEKTMGATKEVGDNIQSIQHLAQLNVSGMDKAVEAINGATDISHTSGDKLTEIVNMTQEAAAQVQSIAAAAEQQSAASEQITRSVDEINAIAQDNTDRVNRSDKDIQGLADQARVLSQLVQDLKAESR
ncbi:methyl-accepting chemotaxis protein [Salidesulfovibrio onnuriiensis]|uniref:methyl-accepting chemotaxis protein n=1 Tax=Salidesulfovibrio onnuriiensis TaxID=2583823 RepID=UPI0011CA2FE7|nr:methyl-accepting chemotaxis protein [Salidesulfovibrio onnuriiensis]